jgi:hypothetical protein
MRKPDPRFIGSRISLAQDQKGSLEGARLTSAEKGLASHSFCLILAEEFKVVLPPTPVFWSKECGID